MDRKGMKPLPMLATAVVVIITVIIVLGGSGDGFKKAFGVSEKHIDDFDDCDKDRVANMFDKCPCISTAGVADEKLDGCPKGTSPQTSQKDIQTCTWFASDDGPDATGIKTEKECEEQGCAKDGDDYLTRCEVIGRNAIEVTDDVGKGEATYGDLELVSADFLPKKAGGKLTTDLGGSDTNYKVNVVATFRNVGSESLDTSFSIGAFVCTKDKKSCREVASESFSETLLPISSGDSNNSASGVKNGSVTFDAIIGDNGDPCDGIGNRECYLQIRVDSDNEYAETDEENNKKGASVLLKKQNWEEHSFYSYRGVLLKAEGNGNPGPKTVEVCKGLYKDTSERLGNPIGEDCSAGTTCDGDFTDENMDNGIWQSPGCWLFLDEDDKGGDQCAVAVAPYGTVISLIAGKINYLTNVGHNGLGGSDIGTGDDDPRALLNPAFNTWKAPPGKGSLLCANDASGYTGKTRTYWEACGQQASDDGKIVRLKDGKEFVCRNKMWTYRGCFKPDGKKCK